jgi:hypothetical protein
MPHLLHLVDRPALVRANTALLLGLVWGGLAACAIAAMVYDFRHWFGAW